MLIRVWKRTNSVGLPCNLPLFLSHFSFPLLIGKQEVELANHGSSGVGAMVLCGAGGQAGVALLRCGSWAGVAGGQLWVQLGWPLCNQGWAHGLCSSPPGCCSRTRTRLSVAREYSRAFFAWPKPPHSFSVSVVFPDFFTHLGWSLTPLSSYRTLHKFCKVESSYFLLYLIVFLKFSLLIVFLLIHAFIQLLCKHLSNFWFCHLPFRLWGYRGKTVFVSSSSIDVVVKV